MALTLIVEDGSVVTGANTWADVERLDAYCEAHVAGATVLALDDTVKNTLLVQSMRVMRDGLVWAGEKVDLTQPTPWPRNYCVDREGYELPGDAIPEIVLDAQCEMCIRLYIEDFTSDPTPGVTYERVDVLAVAYSEATVTKRKRMTTYILEMLNPLATLTANQPIRVERG